jgi:hypothetical protein
VSHTATTLIETALTYAEHGWHVLPLHYPKDKRCSCGNNCASPAKHPMIVRGLHDASRDPDTIKGWWTRWPNANIGVRTGPESNLLVVDIDGDKCGFDSWAKLEAENHDYPLTRESATGGGGTHLLFTWPADTTIGNSAGKLGAGIDVRGRNGYIVAPGSIHISGQPYRWCEATRAIQPPPAWLVELLTVKTVIPLAAKRQRVIPHGSPGRGDNYVRAALDGELHALETVTEGQRNNALNRAAYNVGRASHRGTVPDEVLIDALERMGVHLGLTQLEVRNTVRSGFESGKTNPRGGAR